MSAASPWSDLAPRLGSGLAMAAVGAALVWAGGWIFAGGVSLLGGIMVWEAARMFGSAAPLAAAILAAVALALSHLVPWSLVLPVLLAAALVAAGQVPRDRGAFLAFAAWILLACFAIVLLRTGAGLACLLWLVLVVVVSDIAGYFAGRFLGGPKFWPRFSPKKTWSGTVAGWLGAGLVGLAFAPWSGAALIPLSMIVALAGQMGDIGESAMKRRAQVKDSSAIIPGHGGILDRFDAMLGAGVLATLFWAAGLLPGAT